MRKSIALGSATLLGFTGAAVGAQAAQAAPGDCLDYTEHNVGSGALADWYMDCYPLFGFAEVDFDIESTTPFPAGFAALDDPSVTSVSTTGAAGQAYANAAAGEPEGFAYLDFNSATATTQSYSGDIIVAIDSVSTATSLPAGCTGTYSSMYEVTYLPTTVTFTQTVNGEEWRYDVVAAPAPLYIGLNLIPSVPGPGREFDGNASMCVSGEFDTLEGPDGSTNEWRDAQIVATHEADDTLTPYFGNGKSLPTASRLVPTAPIAPPAAPELAATGLDVSAPLGLAALFLSLGVLGGYLHRRRVRPGE